MRFVIILGILLPIVIFFLAYSRSRINTIFAPVPIKDSRKPDYENIAQLEFELLGIPGPITRTPPPPEPVAKPERFMR